MQSNKNNTKMKRIYWVLLTLVFVLILFGDEPVEACLGVNISATNIDQYFSSPGYPNTPYTSNLDCSWTIKSVNEGRGVGVEFMDTAIENSGACANDAIDVYDGSSASSPHLMKFCGTTKPLFKSSGDALFVRFRTNGAVESTGFQARVYNLPVSEPALSFEEIMAIVGSLTLLILLIIFIVACAHKSWSNKLKNKLSNMSFENQVVPLRTTDSFPILPDKPLIKAARGRPTDTADVTIDDNKTSKSRPAAPDPHVREEQALRQLKRERTKVANLPVPKRAELVEEPSTSKGKAKMPKRISQEEEIVDYPVLPNKKGAKPYKESPEEKRPKGDKPTERRVPAHLAKPRERDEAF